MENKQELDFHSVMLMKEKRRMSRSKGKRTYEKNKIRSVKPKDRRAKHVYYDPYNADTYYMEYERC